MTPNVYTIPYHSSFADAVAQGLKSRLKGSAKKPVRCLIVVQDHCAVSALRDAFGRCGLSDTQMVALDDDRALEALLDQTDATSALPRILEPLQRRLILARLIQAAGSPTNAAEAFRMATDFEKIIDDMFDAEHSVAALTEVISNEAMPRHLSRGNDLFLAVLERWPEELKALGCVEPVQRRGMVLEMISRQWRKSAHFDFICAAGIRKASPAIGRLLGTISRLPSGIVILQGLSLGMSEVEWSALRFGAV